MTDWDPSRSHGAAESKLAHRQEVITLLSSAACLAFAPRPRSLPASPVPSSFALGGAAAAALKAQPSAAGHRAPPGETGEASGIDPLNAALATEPHKASHHRRDDNTPGNAPS